MAACLGSCGGGGVPDQGASDALRDALASTRTTLAQIGALPANDPPDGTPDASGAVPASVGPAVSRATVARRAATRRAPDEPARLAAGPGAAATPRQLPNDLPHQAASLLGLPGVLVTRWLGEPSLRRRDGPAEIWLYQGGACALDVILYREDARAAPGAPREVPQGVSPQAGPAAGEGPLTVAYAAARATGTARRSEAACLREIAEHRAASRAAPPSELPSRRA